MYKRKEISAKRKGAKNVEEHENGTAQANDVNAGDPGIKDQKDHNQELGDIPQIPQDVKCIQIKFHSLSRT